MSSILLKYFLRRICSSRYRFSSCSICSACRLMIADVCASLRSMSAFISRRSSSSDCSATTLFSSSSRSSSSARVEASCSTMSIPSFSAFSNFCLSPRTSSSALACIVACSSVLDFSCRVTLFSSSCLSFVSCFDTLSAERYFSVMEFSSFVCSSSFCCRAEILAVFSTGAFAPGAAAPGLALRSATSLVIWISASTSCVLASPSSFASWSWRLFA
mmetsp:Transcript_28196/g.47243  ORF Transcript_28196/g.47243 Transcript_28196/m.47243 type:complete len:216 (-) Transcript_28196:1621-2268(-)